MISMECANAALVKPQQKRTIEIKGQKDITRFGTNLKVSSYKPDYLYI